VSGGVMVLATFVIGRRLAGACAGLVAAWLLATSPPFLFMLMAPMSDVPAAAAWTVALLCITAGTLGSAVAGGLAAAIAILIRPNLAPMAIFPAFWFILEARSSNADRRRYLLQLIGFLAAFLPGILITALLNQIWNGSPLKSGYGTASHIFTISLPNILLNARNYAAWLSQTHTPLAFFGIAALFVPAGWLWSPHTRRSTVIVLGLFIAGIWAEYCAYHTYGAWWDLRFLLPAFGFMTVGMAVVLLRLTGPRPATAANRTVRRVASIIISVAVVLLGLRDARFAVRGSALDQQRWETKYPVAAAIVAARTDPNAVIFSAQHSGSLRYYAGRVTLTYFNLDPAWFERAVSWLDLHGAHPYAVLEDWEVSDFRKHFSPENGVAGLEMTPLVFYNGPSRFYLFDLLPSGARMETIIDPSPAVRCVSPAPPPSLVFK
jgi:4-amino-4-deoxy-L-arabinose transferase-like glycosyltransferase